LIFICHQFSFFNHASLIEIIGPGAANPVLEIASSKPMKVSPAIGCHAKATLDSAKICRETSKECTHRDKGFSESSWLPKMRDPKGTTKDPEEPIPKVGQKVHCFLETHFTSTLLLFLNSNLVSGDYCGPQSLRILQLSSSCCGFQRAVFWFWFPEI